MGSKASLDIRFGKWLSHTRQSESYRWSQTELAQQVERFGLKWYGSTVAKIELGERPVKLAELVAVAELFNVSVDSLLKLGVKPKGDQARALMGAADTAINISSALTAGMMDIDERLQDLNVSGEDLPVRAELIDGYRQVYLKLIDTDRLLTYLSQIARENAGELLKPKGGYDDDNDNR